MSHHSDSAARRFDQHVVAVVVAHDGARWLPHLISALEASTVFPDRLVAIDTGSTDGSRDVLVQALGASSVYDAPAQTGFGAAVSTALKVSQLASVDSPSADDGWVWLLHDDCAPAPDALEQLLAVATSDPSIAVLGGRIRAWPRARRLLEVGVTITGTGHRETGVEVGEYDQGQHDEQREVLAVSSAGMLVRRSVWEALHGFDPRLPLFRDDVDFGWRVARSGHRVVVVPSAIVFHAEAATRGVRGIANTSASPHLADRKAALFTLLANC
ncbi:MAG: glycosyltransferase family 2 protein, partial [Nocardioidaceae bacterium]